MIGIVLWVVSGPNDGASRLTVYGVFVEGASGTIVVLTYVLVAISLSTVGAVIASRVSQNPIGWILLGLGLWASLAFFVSTFLAYLAATDPSRADLGDVAGWLGNWMFVPLDTVPITFILMLVPDGRLASLRGDRDRGCGCIQSDHPRRHGGGHPQISAVRHRPVDQPHRRLPLVIGTLAFVYGAVTLGLPQILRLPVDSPLMVATATLAAAALFRPLSRRLQALVDRRFNRSPYDAQQEIDRFISDLARTVDLDHVISETSAILRRTVQPDEVGVWIRRTP